MDQYSDEQVAYFLGLLFTAANMGVSQLELKHAGVTRPEATGDLLHDFHCEVIHRGSNFVFDGDEGGES